MTRIAHGSLVHADETKVRLIGKSGFVWILASLEDVVFCYSDTREGGMVQELLKDFRGVLVSDFYAVYDSINCSQQKCLIHLMRDINDDLYRHPYDEDLRKIATEYAGLIRPMIETIDKRGLKKQFLTRHVPEVERFFRWLVAEKFDSQTAQGYQKRFAKNRGKLFTFLAHDGVPWNNNNAENAIRAFAELRRVTGGTWTEKGLREYLVLLSICETCKRRGINFLDFMLSGETTIEESAAGRSSQIKTARDQERQWGKPKRSPRRSPIARKSDSRVPGGVSVERLDDCHLAQVVKKREPRPRHKDLSSDERKLDVVRAINDRCKSRPKRPIFHDAITCITNQLAFRRQDGQVTYFNGDMPVFSHAETDIATFRMITSQFCVTGHVKQRDIVRAFGVTSKSVMRWVKIYREKGAKGFYVPRVRRGPGVLVEAVVSEIEGRLAGGATPAKVARTLGLKLNTIQKAMREGRGRAPVKKISLAMPR